MTIPQIFKHYSTSRFSNAFLSIVLFVCLSGCETTQKQSSSSETANSPTATLDKTDLQAPEIFNDLCTNEYYPINAETNQEFRMSQSSDSTYIVSRKLGKIDTFVESRKFSSGTEIVNNWQCTEDGLRNVEFNNSAVSSNFKMVLETLESSGITLPKIWEKGKTWKAEYKIQAKYNVAKISGAAEGTVTIANEIASMDETIKVAAGEFNAARVDSDLVLSLKVNGRTIPSTTFTMSNWYAPGVGLVKQVNKSKLGSETVEFVGKK